METNVIQHQCIFRAPINQTFYPAPGKGFPNLSLSKVITTNYLRKVDPDAERTTRDRLRTVLRDSSFLFFWFPVYWHRTGAKQ